MMPQAGRYRIFRGSYAVALVTALAFLLFFQSVNSFAQGLPKEIAESIASSEKALARGDLAEAEAHTKRAILQAGKRLGSEHLLTGYLHFRQASLLRHMGRWDQARSSIGTAVRIIAPNSQKTDPNFLMVRSLEAEIYFRSGDATSAAKILMEVVPALRPMINEPQAQATYVLAAEVYDAIGNPADGLELLNFALPKIPSESRLAGEARLQRLINAVAARKTVLARRILPSVKSKATKTQKLAVEFAEVRLLRNEGMFHEAIALISRLIAELDDAVPPRIEARLLHEAGDLHLGRGQTGKARRFYERALGILEEAAVAGRDRSSVLTGLAAVETRAGRHDLAADLYAAAEDSLSSFVGKDSLLLLPIKTQRATALLHSGEIDAAKLEIEAAASLLAQRETVAEAKDRFSVGLAEAEILEALGHMSDAHLKIREVASVAETDPKMRVHLLPETLTRLARYEIAAGDLSKARQAIETAISIREGLGSAGPSKLINSLTVRLRIERAEERDRVAEVTAQRISDMLQDYIVSGGAAGSEAIADEVRTFRTSAEAVLATLVESSDVEVSRLVAAAQIAQWSATAVAHSTTILRQAAGEGAEAPTIMRRQDIVAEIQQLRAAITQSIATNGSPAVRDIIRENLDARSRELIEIDEKLARTAPILLDQLQFRPADPGDLKASLGSKEAILLQVTDDEATYLILIRPTDILTAITDLGSDELDLIIRKLRIQLNPEKLNSYQDFQDLDTAALYRLYEGIFEPFERNIFGVDHLIFIGDRGMQSLPPHMLLSQPVEAPVPLNEFGNLPYLFRQFAISSLPSAAVFPGLRALNSTMPGRQRFLGIADPDFKGTSPGGKRGIDIASLLRGDGSGLANPDLLREKLISLPETADEVLEVSKLFAPTRSRIITGAEASEQTIKKLGLAEFSIIHFATHGLLASETGYLARGLAEPSLALTPPLKASGSDDGLLTASEIAGLQMRAELVVLSACNTASPSGRPGAEGLSGLSKAFFIAGAERLMVSHWYVYSAAAKELVVHSFRARTNGALTWSAALRDAMLEMLERPADADLPVPAHPASWAAFIIIGA